MVDSQESRMNRFGNINQVMALVLFYLVLLVLHAACVKNI